MARNASCAHHDECQPAHDESQELSDFHDCSLLLLSPLWLLWWDCIITLWAVFASLHHARSRSVMMRSSCQPAANTSWAVKS